ncbi:AAA family ATPase [Nocardioides gilvus]|uniref:AAA family ATPase n=1 Tax=Nocardioides gilvus TaxID=1735589 RepID=UPI000D74762A|nr:SMC family ATPase [Nocardioides gilvus]
MKIHRLTLTGFGPFRGTEVVDFDAFAGDGKFVITGKTGAGKSTLLDGVTFALFGHVPRYGNVSDDRVRSDYLKQTTETTEVVLEFSTVRARYRVTRRPGYSVPGRKTPLPPFAEIEEFRNDEWEVLASRRLTDVSRKIDEVVRLSASQFQQVILLAQGQFEEFLVADSGKRRTLLRQLFDTGRFLDYSDDLDARAAALGSGLALTTAAIDTNLSHLASVVARPLPDGIDASHSGAVTAWAEGVHQEQQEEFHEASAAAERAAVSCQESRTALKQAEATLRAQHRYAAATERLEQLLAEADTIAEARLRLRTAQDAEAIWASVQAHQRALAKLEEAVTSLAEARRSDISDPGDVLDSHDAHDVTVALDGPALVEELRQRESVLRATRERLTELVRSEATLATLARSLDSARTLHERARADQTRLEADREELLGTLPELEKSAAVLATAPQELVDAEQELRTLEKRLRAAETVLALEVDLDAARRGRRDTSEGVVAAAAERADLIARQLGEYASTLAAELVDGDPCAVCGSVVHPAKAQTSTAHVTETDLARAEEAVEAALKAHEGAATQVARLTERLKHAGDEAAGGSVQSWAAAVAEAEATIVIRRRAVLELDEVTARRAKVTREMAKVEEQIGAAKETRHQAETHMTVVQIAHDTKQEAVEAGRGSHTSLGAHLAATEARLTATQELIRALERHAAASETRDAARTTLAGLLEKYDFSSSDAAVAARLPLGERSSLQARISAHEAGVAAQRQILADPELSDLPDEPIDVAPLQARCDTADLENQAAAARLGEVKTRVTQVETCVDRLRNTLAQAGAAQHEFELVDGLARAVRGQSPNTRKMTLETFALAADLEEIVIAANALLARMTSHRYELRYSDELAKGGAQSGLTIDVVDAYNSETRSPRSLSGGEKFQASLALALGLAEVVTQRNGGVRLDTLFIDEGFGSLDTETLDTTLDTIDALREGGRTVGLISHVDQVKERIPHHLKVSVTSQGWSRIER